MPRRGGWTRTGPRKPFRYFDARGNRITDPARVLEQIESLGLSSPAWQDVSDFAAGLCKAPGNRDKFGRPPGSTSTTRIFRAEREQAKFDKLVLFADRLPWLREAMAEHVGPVDDV